MPHDTDSDGSEDIGGFRVEGLVGDLPVTAVFVSGRLHCHPVLLAQAEGVVSCGATFGGGDLPYVRASLTGDRIATLLTVLRAMSVIDKVEITSASS